MTENAEKLIPLRFLRNAQPYNAGEIAGFPKHIADRFIADGCCELAETPDQIEARLKQEVETAARVAEENRAAAEAKALADAEAEDARAERTRLEDEAILAQFKATIAAEAGSEVNSGQEGQTTPSDPETKPEGQPEGSEPAADGQTDETKTEDGDKMSQPEEAKTDAGTEQPAQQDKELQAPANKMMTGKNAKTK